MCHSVWLYVLHNAVIRMLDGCRFVGMPSCVTLPCGDIVLCALSRMTLPSVPVSSLQMSWFLHCGDWHFSWTSACAPSVLPAVPRVFISSWSKYNSLWLSVSFEISRACMPCFLVITCRIGRLVLASLAPAMHIFIQWFALPYPRQVDPWAGQSSKAFV